MRTPLDRGLAGLLLLTAFAQRLSSQDLPKLLNRTTVVSVDPSTSLASGVLYVRNDASTAVRAQISASDFISKTTGKGLDARATFTSPGDKTAVSVLTLTVPPNEVLPVRIDVANAWEAGESEADVLANGTSIGTWPPSDRRRTPRPQRRNQPWPGSPPSLPL